MKSINHLDDGPFSLDPVWYHARFIRKDGDHPPHGLDMISLIPIHLCFEESAEWGALTASSL